jgi:hypothetical protein
MSLTVKRPSIKGSPFQLAMALCNALRDASAFSAHPRPCSGSADLMVLSTLASLWTHPNAHWRLFVGHERTRSARAPPDCWFLPRQRPLKASMDTEQLSGLSNSCVLDLVLLVLHPCHQSGAHLACTRPPDFVASRHSFTVSAPRPVSSLELATPWLTDAGGRRRICGSVGRVERCRR